MVALLIVIRLHAMRWAFIAHDAMRRALVQAFISHNTGHNGLSQSSHVVFTFQLFEEKKYTRSAGHAGAGLAASDTTETSPMMPEGAAERTQLVCAAHSLSLLG